jgi:hypothetical protein
MHFQLIRYIITLVCFFAYISGSLALSYNFDSKSKHDSVSKHDSKSKVIYQIGFYAGANNSLSFSNNNLNPGPSYLIYGQFGLSKKCEIGFGIGAIFYKGKSLSYYDAKLIVDTVDIKSYTVTSVGYATVPIFFKYGISSRSKIVLGVRVSGLLFTDGTGSFSYYRPSRPDSVVNMSTFKPNLPSAANFIDVGGIIGYEFAFSKHLKASLLFNINAIPIDSKQLTDYVGAKTGNYNVSGELGLHYLFNSHTRE